MKIAISLPAIVNQSGTIAKLSGLIAGTAYNEKLYS
jgi:hypothetical protein